MKVKFLDFCQNIFFFFIRYNHEHLNGARFLSAILKPFTKSPHASRFASGLEIFIVNLFLSTCN